MDIDSASTFIGEVVVIVEDQCGGKVALPRV